MTNILLLSDTHSYLDPRIIKHFKNVDEVWHAGDIGNLEVMDEIKKHCPTLRAVYGNIDNHEIRREFKKDEIFTIENVSVWITHIGGYPGKYPFAIYQKLKEIKPLLFICGHSHILKVMFDQSLQCLHINPGAIGTHGFQQVQTAVLFSIHGDKISDLKIIELERKATL
jgi:putative phosphoesterase